MSGLAATTCVVHDERSAAARCPVCERFFCSECITEHDGRLSCAACLAKERAESGEQAKLQSSPSFPRVFVPWLVMVIQAVFALLLCWSIYYSLARLLMLIPADFHDGTLWED